MGCSAIGVFFRLCRFQVTRLAVIIEDGSLELGIESDLCVVT